MIASTSFVQRIRTYSEDGSYSETTSLDLVTDNKNCFIGWKCSAGINSLYIKKDGSIFSAHCESIGIYGKQGSFGNIYDNFEIPSQWINCARRNCISEFDLAIPKIRKSKYKDLLALTQNKEVDFSKQVSEIDSAVGIEGLSYSGLKHVFWELDNFDLHQMRMAVNNLERFAKGSSLVFNFFCNSVEENLYIELVKFIVEDKGHITISVMDNLKTNQFYQTLIGLSDLKLKSTKDDDLDAVKTISELITKEIFHLKHKKLPHGFFELLLPASKVVEEKFKSLNHIEHVKMLFSEKYLPQDEQKSIISANPESNKILSESVGEDCSRLRILCFIPMRNCEKTIEEVLNQFNSEILKYIDLILVQDNDSSDNSVEVAQSTLKKINLVKTHIRKNERNYGFGGSHKLAFQYAYYHGFDYILIVHGDNSGNVADFLPILEDQKFKNFEMILSNRFCLKSKRLNYPWYRLWGNHFLSLLITVFTFKKISDFSSGPINMYRVSTFINKYEAPVKAFNNLISFSQDMLLYGLFRRSNFLFLPINFKEAGGKTFFSALTQFFKSIILILKYFFMKEKLFRLTRKVVQ
jgi:hypothetical protein